MAAGLTGCFSTTRLVQKIQAPDSYKSATVEQLETQLAQRDDALKTVNAQVMVTATTGGAKEGKETEYTSFRGYIFVQKPERLRVILQLPVIGSRAMDMVSDGKTFTLLIPPKNKAIIGSNTLTKPASNGLYNLRPSVFLDSLLVPGLQPGEFLTLTESMRQIAEETRRHDAVEEPDYDLNVLRLKAGNVMLRERTIRISRVTMLPFEQDTYDENGRMVTVATYDNYQPTDASGVAVSGTGGTANAPSAAGGQMFPMLVTIKRPLDEYSLKIEVTKVTLNETFESDQFELKVPAGVSVQQMQ
jgi:outer membrane lipoprotein-sorting protein